MLWHGGSNSFFKPEGETPVCDHSNESYWAVLSCDTVYIQGGSNYLVCGWTTSAWPFNWELLNSTFKVVDKVVLTLMPVNEILAIQQL